jgi:hypothetical protein
MTPAPLVATHHGRHLINNSVKLLWIMCHSNTSLVTGNSGTQPLHLPCFPVQHRPWSVQSAPATSLIHA